MPSLGRLLVTLAQADERRVRAEAIGRALLKLAPAWGARTPTALLVMSREGFAAFCYRTSDRAVRLD